LINPPLLVIVKVTGPGDVGVIAKVFAADELL
jgi:hypothetical protein